VLSCSDFLFSCQDFHEEEGILFAHSCVFCGKQPTRYHACGCGDKFANAALRVAANTGAVLIGV